MSGCAQWLSLFARFNFAPTIFQWPNLRGWPSGADPDRFSPFYGKRWDFLRQININRIKEKFPALSVKNSCHSALKTRQAMALSGVKKVTSRTLRLWRLHDWKTVTFYLDRRLITDVFEVQFSVWLVTSLFHLFRIVVEPVRKLDLKIILLK